MPIAARHVLAPHLAERQQPRHVRRRLVGVVEQHRLHHVDRTQQDEWQRHQHRGEHRRPEEPGPLTAVADEPRQDERGEGLRGNAEAEVDRRTRAPAVGAADRWTGEQRGEQQREAQAVEAPVERAVVEHEWVQPPQRDRKHLVAVRHARTPAPRRDAPRDTDVAREHGQLAKDGERHRRDVRQQAERQLDVREEREVAVRAAGQVRGRVRIEVVAVQQRARHEPPHHEVLTEGDRHERDARDRTDDEHDDHRRDASTRRRTLNVSRTRLEGSHRRLIASSSHAEVVCRIVRA